MGQTCFYELRIFCHCGIVLPFFFRWFYGVVPYNCHIHGQCIIYGHSVEFSFWGLVIGLVGTIITVVLSSRKERKVEDNPRKKKK